MEKRIIPFLIDNLFDEIENSFAEHKRSKFLFSISSNLSSFFYIFNLFV